jgi:hypothetical protein
MVEAAAKHGIVAMGHVPSGLTYEQARIPDTQHLMGVTLPSSEDAPGIRRIIDWRSVTDLRIDEVVRASAELGLAHTPTLVLSRQLFAFEDYERAVVDPAHQYIPGMYRKVVWHPQDGLPIYRGLKHEDFELMRDAWTKKLRLVGRLHEAGVTLRAGTDTQQPFVVPGLAVQQEIQHFVSAGIPLEEAWAHATWRSADGVAIADLGRLTPGAPADLLVFRDDPTKDIAAFATLEAVVVRGHLYRHSDLIASLEAWRGFYENVVIDFVAQAVAKRRMKGALSGD